MRTIDKIEHNLSHERDVTKAYQNFVDLVSSEMEVKLKKKSTAPPPPPPPKKKKTFVSINLERIVMER